MKNKIIISLLMLISLTGCFPVKDKAYHKTYATKEELFRQILFTGRDKGYAIQEIRDSNTFQTSGFLVKETNDRGKTWEQTLKVPGETARLSHNGKNVYLHTRYYSKKEKNIIYSSNGREWVKKDSFNFDIQHIFYKDSLSVYYLSKGFPAAFYESRDGGKNWHCFHKPGNRDIPWNLSVTDSVISYFTSSEDPAAAGLLVRLDLKEKRTDKIPLPQGVEGSKMAGNILTGTKDNHLLVYRIDEDHTLTHLYTFKTGKKLSANYISKYQDKVYLCINDFTGAVFMDYFLYCSEDGGVSWQELHPGSLWGEFATYGDENGFALWICTYNQTEYINF